MHRGRRVFLVRAELLLRLLLPLSLPRPGRACVPSKKCGTANKARENEADADDEANQAAVVLALEIAGEECARHAKLLP